MQFGAARRGGASRTRRAVREYDAPRPRCKVPSRTTSSEPYPTMHRIELDYPDGWRAVSENEAARAATMVLAPGESEGGPRNLHPHSDQWIVVTGGTGVAIVEGGEQPLAPGVLLRVDRGETHEIRNTGAEPLRTLSLYVPPLSAA